MKRLIFSVCSKWQSCLPVSGVQVDALEILECPKELGKVMKSPSSISWAQIWYTQGESNHAHMPLFQKKKKKGRKLEMVEEELAKKQQKKPTT